MSDDQVGCERVSVSSGTGLPGLSRTKAVKRLCVCVCVCVYINCCHRTILGCIAHYAFHGQCGLSVGSSSEL